MSSKRRGRLETTKPKEEILLPPCTVKPLVVNGSRRVLPYTATQIPTSQVVDGYSEPRQSMAEPLVMNNSEQSMESLTMPEVEVGLVPCIVTPQAVDDSRVILSDTTTTQIALDSRRLPERTTTPYVVNNSTQPLTSSGGPDMKTASYAVRPQVVNGSRSPLPHPVVPVVDPMLSPSSIVEDLSDAFPPQSFFNGLTSVPIGHNTSLFPPQPLNSSFIQQSQSPIYIYSPATYETSQPSIPLWTPTPFSSESRSSPVTRSSTAQSSHRISKHHASRSTPYGSPSSSSPHSKSSPVSISTHKTPFTSLLTPPDALTTGNNPSRNHSQAPNAVWTPAEDVLLRSLVHVSRNGTNDCDPSLSWMEIAERMNAYVEEHGPLGAESNETTNGQEGSHFQQRIYHTNKLARRWGKIGGEQLEGGGLW